jgi:hypothetical protein
MIYTSKSGMFIEPRRLRLFGVADLGYESFYLQFLKPRLKLTFRYMQNWNSYLD